MKKLLLSIFTFLLFLSMAEAQAPQAFKYQAVVRDASGQVIAGGAVGLQISLIADNGADTATVYVETHEAVTNDFGLVNLEIGRGTPTSGDFSMIDWANTMYIRIGLDAAGGSSYEDMGFSELLSVPYALHAGNAGEDQVDDADADPTNELQDWTTLPGIPADIADGDQVDDADADPTNELEMPADAERGNLAYFDGESWQKIATGGAGQVLTLGDDGIPYWGGVINITLPDGNQVFFSPADNFGGLLEEKVVWGPNVDIEALPNLTKAQAIVDYDGPGNTQAIIAQVGEYNPPNSNLSSYAAKLCDDLIAFGYDDWYLPSAGELLYAATQTELSFDESTLHLTSTEINATEMWYYFQGVSSGGSFPADIYDGLDKDGGNNNASLAAKCRCARRN
jgi:hypothetical protein